VLRRRYLQGDFTAGMVDHDQQLIPTAWVIAAQERWTAQGGKVEPMTAMGLDPAGGGRDSAELAARHGGWYAPLVSAKGPETADGSATAAMVTKHRRNAAPIIVDVGGGYASGVVLRLKDNAIPFSGFNGAGASTKRTKDKMLSFVNKRAEAWWRFMEELDPDQEGGSVIALPPDAELLGDLVAPRYEVRAKGILIESKDEIRKRLGRSPGKGDAVVMAMSEGDRARLRMQNQFGYSGAEQGLPGENHGRPQVVMGHQAVRRSLGRQGF
jgi:hypothetical protein